MLIRIMLRSFSVSALLLLLLAATVTATIAAETTQFAYGVNAGDWSVSQYRVNPQTGALSLNGHVPALKFPAALAVHPSKRFLMSAIKTTAEVRVYRIDAGTGRLTEIPESPFKAEAASPYAISFHPSGRFVYIAARGGSVAAFSVNQKNGVLTPVPGSPFAAELRTRSLKVHPSGRFVYASNAHSNSISAYRVNEKTGALSHLPESPYSTGATMVVDPDEHNIYDAPASAGGSPYRVEIHPSGRFIFVTNWMGLSLSVFKVDITTGALSPVKGSPIGLDDSGRPYAVTVHPSGRFIYISSWDNHLLWGYRFDEATGQLEVLPNSPFQIGGFGPIDIEFNKTGSRAYLTNMESNTITQYAVDAQNGQLVLQNTIRTRYKPFDFTLLENEPVELEQPFSLLVENDDKQLRVLRMDVAGAVQASKQSVAKQNVMNAESIASAVDPRGHFIYRALKREDQPKESGIAVYRINPKSNVLTMLPKLTFRLGFIPTELVVDKSGYFLYAINPDIKQMGVFNLDRDSGAMSLPTDIVSVNSPPPITGTQPSAMALDPVERFSFVTNSKSNTVSVFTHSRVQTPAMYPINYTGSAFATGDNPVALTVDPTGKYLVVANKDSNNLSVFNIHFHQGRLTPVEGSPFAAGDKPVSVVVHPDGKWVYVLNAGGGDILSYQLDQKTGVLKKLEHRISAGKQPVKLVLDSTGHFAYVQNKNTSMLRKYTLDTMSGKLTFSGEVDLGENVAFVR